MKELKQLRKYSSLEETYTSFDTEEEMEKGRKNLLSDSEQGQVWLFQSYESATVW